jgi:hypothetical protein
MLKVLKINVELIIFCGEETLEVTLSEAFGVEVEVKSVDWSMLEVSMSCVR